MTGVNKSWLVNDFIIEENNCNLKCSYCLTGQSNFKLSHNDQEIFEPPKKKSCLPGTDLEKRLQKMTANVERLLDVSALKVSGGEVFLIEGFVDFLLSKAPCYDHVQILTNGIPISEKELKLLLKAGNISFQISMDSHELQGNSYRFGKSKNLQDRLLKNLDTILGFGFPVEIYCVVTNRNISELNNFVSYLERYQNHSLIFFPFPSRGPDAAEYCPPRSKWNELDKLIDRNSAILPPKPYLERLKDFYEQGGRTWACHLTRMVFSSFDDGAVTACPNIWFKNIGNALLEEDVSPLEKLGKDPFYHLLLADRPRLEACKNCFTPWEMLSLYFEDEITLGELSKTPLYSHERTQLKLMELKQNYLEVST